tara:strand:+ start:658 stop:1596 length:939 start_codon:yes stop_codon:yes gene_type:complete
MKINSLNILINQASVLNKKFYFISGNEKTLMEKIKTIIIEGFKEKQNVQIKSIETIIDFVDEVGLFENKSIYIVNGNKGIDIEVLDNLRSSESHFIFLQENSQKIKKIKNLFITDKDSYLIDCYELDKDSKIKILNEFLRVNKLEILQDVYWFLIDKLDSKYIFFEKNLNKVLELDKQDITLDRIKKILTVDESGKERIFFNLLKKNKEILGLYRDKIINNSDVNELYYNSKFFCQLIIDCNSEDEYKKKIPMYLFKEKNYLIDIYRKYNSKKKKMLLKLLSSTENILRKQSSLSLVIGLRFLLNIKKITIS